MSSRVAFLFGVALFAGIGTLPQAANAETIELGNDGSLWKLGDNEGESPLMVQVKPGDVINIMVEGPHGLATLNKPGDQTPAVDLSHVVMCSEDPASKPNAGFEEIDCSRMNKVLTPSMQVRVLPTFNQEVHFWCLIHKRNMIGTFKPAP